MTYFLPSTWSSRCFHQDLADVYRMCSLQLPNVYSPLQIVPMRSTMAWPRPWKSSYIPGTAPGDPRVEVGLGRVRPPCCAMDGKGDTDRTTCGEQDISPKQDEMTITAKTTTNDGRPAVIRRRDKNFLGASFFYIGFLMGVAVERETSARKELRIL